MKLISTLKRLAVGALALLGAQSALADTTEFSYTTTLSSSVTAEFKCNPDDNSVVTGGLNKTCEIVRLTSSASSSLTIPETITVTGRSDQENGTYYITSIGNNAFKGDTKIFTVAVNAKILNIGSEAFSNCTNLRRIDFNNPVESNDYLQKPYTALGFGVFKGCTELVWADLSNLFSFQLGTKTTGGASMGDSYFFESCYKLTTLKLPKGLVEIPGRAFKGCSSLTKIEIPEGVERVGTRAFEQCSKLEYVIFPSTLKGGYSYDQVNRTIGGDLFYAASPSKYINVRFLSTDPSIIDIGTFITNTVSSSNIRVYHPAAARLGEESYEFQSGSGSSGVQPDYYVFALQKAKTANASIDETTLKSVNAGIFGTESAVMPDELLTAEEVAMKATGTVSFLRKSRQSPATNALPVTITPVEGKMWRAFQTFDGDINAVYTQGTGSAGAYYVDRQKIVGDMTLIVDGVEAADTYVEFDYNNVHYRINEATGVINDGVSTLRTVVATGLADVIKAKAEGQNKGEGLDIVIGNTATDPATNTSYFVTDIAEKAFYQDAFSSIDMSEAVHLSVLRNRAFAENPNLTKVAFSPATNTIMPYCFNKCTALSETFDGGSSTEGHGYLKLHEGLNYIKGASFTVTSITRALIPSTVVELGYNVFSHVNAGTDREFRIMGSNMPKINNSFFLNTSTEDVDHTLFYAQAEHRASLMTNDWWRTRHNNKKVRYIYHIDTKILPEGNPLGLNIDLSKVPQTDLASELDPTTHTVNCAIFDPQHNAANINTAEITWTANVASKGNMSLVVASMGDNNNHVSREASITDYDTKEATSKIDNEIQVYGDVLLTLSGAPTYRVTVRDPNSMMLVARRVDEGTQTPILVSLDESHRTGYKLEDIRNHESGVSILGNAQSAPVRKAAAASATPTGEYPNDYYFLSEPITKDTQYDIIWSKVTTQAPQAVADRIEGVRVYPATMSIHIEGLDGIDVDADVIDSNGRVLYTGQERVIEVPAAGVYLVRIAGTVYKLAVN